MLPGAVCDCYCCGGLQLRAYCAGLSQEQKGGQTAVLIRQLADWGMAAKQMHEVIRLPLDGLAEQVCLSACLSVFCHGCFSEYFCHTLLVWVKKKNIYTR